MAKAEGGQPKILDVGQCDHDHGKLVGFLGGRFDARLDRAHGLDDARALLEESRYRLVLVNRLLDVDQTPGLDVIKALKADADPNLSGTPMMLVSNLPEAQREAVAAGAVPGFGKAQFDDPEVARRVAAVLA